MVLILMHHLVKKDSSKFLPYLSLLPAQPPHGSLYFTEEEKKELNGTSAEYLLSFSSQNVMEKQFQDTVLPIMKVIVCFLPSEIYNCNRREKIYGLKRYLRSKTSK
jgi:hypothetical protein